MTDDFTEVNGIGDGTQDKLEKAGFSSWDAIAHASPQKLQDKADVGESTSETLLEEARKRSEMADFQTAKDMRDSRGDVFHITAGVDEIDELLDGGIETNSIFETYGEFGSGKSQVTHQLCVTTQLPEEYGGAHGRAMFIDTEESFRPKRIEQMVSGLREERKEALMDVHGVEEDSDTAESDLVDEVLAHIHVVQAHNSDHQIMLLEKAMEVASGHKESDFPIRLLCVDSLMSYFRSEYVGRGALAQRQQKISKHMYDMKKFSNLYNAAVVITNQVQSDPDAFFGDPTKPIGGNIVGHTSNYRVYLKNKKDNKRAFELVDAPALPDGEVLFKITNDGLESA